MNEQVFFAKDIEIMSPVGSMESLMAAIQAGAGSVYFGIGKLNMRSRSSKNFTISDLKEITTICRQNNVRSYITLNTIIYDEEIPHVAAGTRWFLHICQREKLNPTNTFKTLLQTHYKGILKPPFNNEARALAGMPNEFYQP